MDAARAQALFEQFFSGMGGGFGGDGMGGNGARSVRSSGRKGGGGADMFSMDMEDGDPFARMLHGGLGGLGGLSGLGGARGGTRRPRAPEPTGCAEARVDTLAVGTLVRLEGLNSPTHNGCVGRVEAFDEAKGRYIVTLQRDGGSLAVRPAHCVQVVTDARVTGTSKGELNGRTAAVTTYDRTSKRYRCEGLKADGTVLSLKPENVVLPPTTRVKIDGVASRPALNGCVGAVRAVDEQAGRYDVELPGEAVRVRFGAVAAC